MWKNVFYFYRLAPIGGIETFYYQLAKRFYDSDITIVYQTADKAQLRRLKKYVRCVKFTKGSIIKCEKIFFNFNLDIINNVEAKEYNLLLHGVYKKLGLAPPQHPKINNYYGVSQAVCDSFYDHTGKHAKLLYNPFQADKPKKILHLISATRLTPEKGRSRMEKLAAALDSAGIPFQWLVFTNKAERPIENKSIYYMEPRLDITNYIADADYLVQLSNTEGYCYAVAEALTLGTPVIVTDLPVFKEMKIQGYTLPLNMSNVPVKEIYENKIKVNWKAPETNWGEVLVAGASTYDGEEAMGYTVRALPIYEAKSIQDSQLGRIPKPGETWELEDESRLHVLLGNNPYKVPFVELVVESKSDSPTMEWTKKELIEYAEKHNIEIDPKKNKAAILKLLL